MKKRFALRNQKKIIESFGENFNKCLVLSLKEYFNSTEDIPEYDYDKNKHGYKTIHVPNAQPKTDSFFELYVISKKFNVWLLAYKSCAG